MTDIFKTPEKVDLRDRLFQAGVRTLEREGWQVSRVDGMGKASVRRITRDGQDLLVSIRTTQDQFIAFPPKTDGRGWITLDDVQAVIAVSVDANVPPRNAFVHWLPGDEMRERFNRALRARTDAGRSKPPGRGIWLPLYIEDENTVRFVGGGFGLAHPAIATLRLAEIAPSREASERDDFSQDLDDPHERKRSGEGGGSVIAAAKRMISQSLGVPEASIRITIEA